MMMMIMMMSDEQLPACLPPPLSPSLLGLRRRGVSTFWVKGRGQESV